MAFVTSEDASDMHHARTLLDRIPALRRPCDLDLLVFFAKHWRAILSSEQIAHLLGYPLKEIALSRDALVAAGVLTRAQDSTRAARMYVFDPEGINGDALRNVLTLASSSRGRLALRRALTYNPAGPTNNLSAENPAKHDPRPHRNNAGTKPTRPNERRSNEQQERNHGRS